MKKTRNAYRKQTKRITSLQRQHATVSGNDSDSAELRRRAIECYNRANELREDGKSECAIAEYRKALQLDADYAHAHNNLGNMLFAQKDYTAARYHFGEALRLNSGYANAHYNMAVLLQTQKQFEEADRHFCEALRIQPDYTQAYIMRGVMCSKAGRLSEALHYYRRALSIESGKHTLYNNIATCLKGQGYLEDAYAWFAAALRCDSEAAEVGSNLLMDYHYHTYLDNDFIFSEHQRWAALHETNLQAGFNHRNMPCKARKLKIGYVSPDFQHHSVAYFSEPLLMHHDHDAFDVYCYSNGTAEDDFTERFRSYADHWRAVRGMRLDEIYALVKRDEIDILVDLAGHTANNLLPLFGRKPAPVQVSCIGYPNTTGMQTMDYRITDAVADPPGSADELYSERLVRLDDCFLCYRPLKEAPEVSQLPAKSNGMITFASLNNLTKITPDVVRVWAEILKEIPQARLVLKAAALHDKATRERYLAMFAFRGVPDNRIALHGSIPGIIEHLCLYTTIDIALDPFPYNGTTTTCEALWMGVPVLSLAGTRHAARVGASLLSCAGLSEWIADSEESYVNKAVAFAANIEQLAHVRCSLRDRMRATSLVDAKLYAGRMEKAYRVMWNRWCDGETQRTAHGRTAA